MAQQPGMIDNRAVLESKDAFIIKYFQNNKHNDRSINISCFDQRRVVFISLYGLYRSWQQCPSVVLYSAMFILSIETDWIYNHSKYRKQQHDSSTEPCSDDQFKNMFLDLARSEDFIALLKWKNSQCLLFCTLDNNKDNSADNNNALIHPFWHHLNKYLINMYDAVTQKQYKPLLLNTTRWCGVQWKSKYDVKTASVLCELYFVRMKYKTMQEIIYQSNPESLCPIVSYNANIYDHEDRMRKLCTVTTDLCDCIDEDERNDWVITDDYM